jgi:Membrane domain of glycerophosphoryl diester phosphodiesterase
VLLVALAAVVAIPAAPIAIIPVAGPVLFFGWFMYFVVRMTLPFEAFMLERLGPWAAVKASWNLTRGHFWWMTSVLLLAALTVIVPLLLVSLLGAVSAGGRDGTVVLGGLLGVVQAVLLVPLIAFFTAVTTLSYLSLRSPTHV